MIYLLLLSNSEKKKNDHVKTLSLALVPHQGSCEPEAYGPRTLVKFHPRAQLTVKIGSSRKFHTAPDQYPTMHHFLTEMWGWGGVGGCKKVLAGQEEILQGLSSFGTMCPACI